MYAVNESGLFGNILLVSPGKYMLQPIVLVYLREDQYFGTINSHHILQISSDMISEH